MTTQTLPDVGQRVSNLEGQMTQIDARLSDMNENITARFTSVETRLTALDGKIDGLRNILIIASAGIIGTLAAAIVAVILAV